MLLFLHPSPSISTPNHAATTPWLPFPPNVTMTLDDSPPNPEAPRQSHSSPDPADHPACHPRAATPLHFGPPLSSTSPCSAHLGDSPWPTDSQAPTSSTTASPASVQAPTWRASRACGEHSTRLGPGPWACPRPRSAARRHTLRVPLSSPWPCVDAGERGKQE